MAGTISATSVYTSLGVRTFINAAGEYTRLGGSRMPVPVVEAMRAAAAHFVEIEELQARVGERIAALTGNQAAYVTCGAAAGLFLATAACMIGANQTKARQLPNLHGLPTRVVVHRAHRNPFDYAVRTLPVELIEIGSTNLNAAPDEGELVQAMTPPTAAVLYVLAGRTPSPVLALERVIALAHERGVPVIVDAAAQLPPRENLWRFTQMGADLVIFSGGKDLRGPQSSGLILGRPDLIAACALIGAPQYGIGRTLKVGKEELAGIAAAVEWYMEQDEAARAQAAEDLVDCLCRLGLPSVRVERRFPNEADQPIARAWVHFEGADGPARRNRVVELLRAGNPSIEVGPGETPDCFYVNPMTVDADEEEMVLAGLEQALREVG